MASMLSLSEMDAYAQQPEPSAAPRRRGLPSSRSGLGGGVSQSLLSAAMASGGEPLLASAPPPSRAGALTRAPGTRGSLSIPEPFAPAKQPMLQVNIPFGADGFPAAAKEELGGHNERALGGGAGKAEGGRAQLMRRQRTQQASFSADAPVMSLEGGDGGGGFEAGGGRQQSFKADAPVNLDDGVKFEEDRRELMTKQKVQQSFVADAEVTLDQVSLLIDVDLVAAGAATERCICFAPFF